MILENTKKTSSLLFKWIFICITVGVLSGSASAFFLVALEWVTQIRENNSWIIWLLPIGGLLIGLGYHYWGESVVKGNNLLLEEYENPQRTIPLKMAPLVLIGTLLTHLFGGSAGREGTAVQMGGAIADQFTKLFQLNSSERKTILILGISAGFASIFGTPLAGALFALEVVYFSKINIKSILLSFLVAYTAYFTVSLWQVQHTHYAIPFVPAITVINLFWVVLVSILFGLAAMLFSRSTHMWSHLFSKTIAFPPLRPFIGGIILAVALFFIGTTKYAGLGIPVIVDAFTTANAPSDFVLKILFTGFTLGAGFKGGEVTPLFFVGATLGSALSLIVPLPIALLAGMGFVAVFSGATHTPIACTVMGLELFGIESGLFVGLACGTAYFCSGSMGIYKAQIVRGAKYQVYQKLKRKKTDFL
ncbi:H+/Cl-antiporter ClcA [Flavobacterium fryxellicola]|uniref:Chloride channel protein n=1 Tax=Flavobacterium fryxellicola TaxID=249352 RepID=A0A167UIP1_9FLAO|nr:voltage-gated chloride channel family protein [Flavobacterium fryxellicola]OAB25630.1 chloride channel protein [Flavobacterium fryxellicola]SHN73740.1 H+/Cl-antiporter ClcA [Flavobacterium fryxellicola]